MSKLHLALLRTKLIIKAPNIVYTRDTALACCIALGVLDKELDALLVSAGYALSEDKRDQAIKFCIEKGIRKVDTVNDVLDALEVKLIGR